MGSAQLKVVTLPVVEVESLEVCPGRSEGGVAVSVTVGGGGGDVVVVVGAVRVVVGPVVEGVLSVDGVSSGTSGVGS